MAKAGTPRRLAGAREGRDGLDRRPTRGARLRGESAVMVDGDLPLTSRQKQLLRDSFEVTQDYSTALTKLFYGRLFETAPAARQLFPKHLDEQSRKLLDMLATIIESLDRFEELRPRLAELGQRHVEYGA